MGPGIYLIRHEESLEEWTVRRIKDVSIIKDLEIELSKVYIKVLSAEMYPYNYGNHYIVYVDCTGHIPAFIRGANMIEEAIKG